MFERVEAHGLRNRQIKVAGKIVTYTYIQAAFRMSSD
jgi:hypothetical protein